MPRPRLNPDARRKDIALTLPPQLIERAKSLCDLAGWSVSALVEESLTIYLNRLDRDIQRKWAKLSPPNAQAMASADEKTPPKEPTL